MTLGRPAAIALLAVALAACGTAQTVRARRVLDRDGIGGVRFGARQGAATAAVERLLGRRHDTLRGMCGFNATTGWIGLRIRTRQRLLSGQLTLYFKRSRFVAYDFLENLTHPAPRRHGPLLATAAGLTLGDTAAHGPITSISAGSRAYATCRR